MSSNGGNSRCFYGKGRTCIHVWGETLAGSWYVLLGRQIVSFDVLVLHWWFIGICWCLILTCSDALATFWHLVLLPFGLFAYGNTRFSHRQVFHTFHTCKFEIGDHVGCTYKTCTESGCFGFEHCADTRQVFLDGDLHKEV